MAFAPKAAIDAPERLPLPYGLFSVASLAEVATERWQNGVVWETVSCDPISIVVGDCDPALREGFPKQFPDGQGTGEADVFTVYGTYKCSGPNAVSLAQEKARETLLNREEAGAETGAWRALARPTESHTPVVVAGGDPLVALARAEKFIGDNYGSLGVLHMTRVAATVLVVKGLIEATGSQMRTELGTPVVVGTGYPGTGIGTFTANANPALPGSWAYAAPPANSEYIVSPMLFGYRSEAFEPTNVQGDLMDRTRNDVFGIAERTYLIGFDPCGVAFIPVNLGV